MSRLSTWAANGPLITDGAWGTELQKRGLPLGTPPDLWNLDRSEPVLEVAQAYVEAGSDIVLTNTFRANAIALPDLSTDQLALLNRRGVEISHEAAQGRVRVVASMGPTGKLLMMGEVLAAQVSQAFRAQARALADAGANGLLIETMSDLEEALLALEAAQETGLPVIVSFAFDSGKRKDRTMMGATPEQVGERLRDAGADAVGANCGAGIEQFEAVCARLKESSGLPVWIKANAGLPTVAGSSVQYSSTPTNFASHLPALVSAGAAFVGGCCGTSPAFIRALVEQRSICGSN